jgi:hypothetical protein
MPLLFIRFYVLDEPLARDKPMRKIEAVNGVQIQLLQPLDVLCSAINDLCGN